MQLGAAFSGGGVRSAAHLGILHAFYQRGIRPGILTGTSGGSIVAALLAVGYTPDTALRRYLEANDIRDIAFGHIAASLIRRQTFDGLYKGKKLEKRLSEAFGGQSISSVGLNAGIRGPVKLAVVSTDIKTGRQIIFTNADTVDGSKINDDNFLVVNEPSLPLSTVIASSCRIPGVFLPKVYQDMTLVDGGITNALPSDIAFALGAERVLSLDLGYSGQVRAVGGLRGILMQSLDIMMERIVDTNKDEFDVYLNPEIYDVGVLDFSRAEECFERGYRYGLGRVEEVLALLERTRAAD